MPDKPTTNTPDDTDDSNSTGSDDEEIVMDAVEVEVEAGFLEDRDPEDYPSVLRITSDSDEAHRQDTLDRLDRWEAGEEVPHVINFQHPSDLRALLTDRRVELLRSIMTKRPDSIRQLAERLDRDVKNPYRLGASSRRWLTAQRDRPAPETASTIDGICTGITDAFN